MVETQKVGDATIVVTREVVGEELVSVSIFISTTKDLK